MVKGIRTTGALALGILVVLGAQHASAHKKVHDSDVTLGLGTVNGGQDTVWYGHVASPRAKCTRNRKVSVYRRVAGPDELIGTDVTGTHPAAADNEYVIYEDGYPPTNGEYVAIAKRKVLRRTSRHRHICARAASTPIGVFTCRGACRSAPSPARL